MAEQLPLIRSIFGFEELLPWSDLSHYANTSVGQMRFFNVAFAPLGDDHESPDLCTAVAAAALGPKACSTCPLREDPPLTEQPVTRRCVAGVQKTAAAVRTAQKVIGYVVGPQIPDAGFYELDLSRLPADLKENLERRKQELIRQDPSGIADVVGRVARRLSRRATLERRLRILRDFRARAIAATTPEEILDSVCHALEAILGSVDLCLYVLAETGSLHLVTARGPHENALPSTLESDDGPVGHVIRKRTDFYVSDLEHGSAGAVHVAVSPPMRSVYIAPMVWGPDEMPAALQAFSPTADGFSLPERQSMQVIADIASLAAVRMFLQRQRRAAARASLIPGNWTSLLLELTAATADDAVQILEAKRRLYDGFVEEGCRVAHAPNAHLRIYDPVARVLRFASCAGAGWTDAAKSRVYAHGKVSAGIHVMETGSPLYVPDTNSEKRFSPTLTTTRSLYVVPFRLQGQVVGVLSVNWHGAEGLEDDYRGQLWTITRQFEGVLAVLHTRQESLFRQIEVSLASTVDIELLVKETANRTRSVFNARGCSVFLCSPGETAARLVATTGPMPEAVPLYNPGDGLTGYVLQSKRSVRIRDTADADELNAIAPGIETMRKWSEDVVYEDAAGRYSFLAAPMIARDQALGVIRLTIKENLTEFSHEEETLLQEIANRLASTIDRVWRDWEAQARLISLEQRADLEDRITEAKTLQGICTVLGQECMRETGAVAAHFRIDTGEATLPLEVGSGLLRGFRFDGLSQAQDLPPVNEPAFEQYVKSTHTWSSLSKWIEERYPESPTARAASVARLPCFLEKDTRLSVVLTLCWNVPQVFDDAFTTMLMRVAKRSAAVLRPPALHRQTRIELDNRVRDLERSRRIGLRFAQIYDPDALMQEVLTAFLNVSHMEFGTIRRITDSDAVLLQGRPTAHSIPMPGTLALSPAMALARASEHCVWLHDTHNDPTWVEYRRGVANAEERAYLDQIRSTLHVPLRLQGRYDGLITLDSTQPRTIAANTIQSFEILSAYAAVAIEFAMMHKALQREIGVAKPLAMMGTMLSGFEHEMRNRIQLLLTILSNLRSPRVDPDKFLEKTSSLRTELKQLQRICSDLAYFSRSDPVTLDEAEDLNKLVERALTDFTPRDRRVTFHKVLSPLMPTVVGNPVQLKMAFQMIIQNALEAMPSGGELTVSTDVSEDARTTTVSFRDTGIGMSEATREQCVRPFFTTKVDRGGTGLGLAVVFGIVLRHAGKVDVQSIEGHGSCISLLFPSEQEFRNARHSDR